MKDMEKKVIANEREFSEVKKNVEENTVKIENIREDLDRVEPG